MQRILLVCRAGESVGIGHLSRITRVAKALKANNFIELRVVIIGLKIQRGYLLKVEHQFYPDSFEIEEVMILEVDNYQPTTIVFDLYSDNINCLKLLHTIKQKILN
jgi:spore coat polysaccharide biosynthesis predicted glycosyltransferase SpsG